MQKVWWFLSVQAWKEEGSQNVIPKRKKSLFQDFYKAFPKAKLFASQVNEELKVQFGTLQGQEWGTHMGGKALPSCNKGETFPPCPGWWPQ